MRFLWADHGIDDDDHDDDSNEMSFSLAQEEKYDRSLIAMKKIHAPHQNNDMKEKQSDKMKKKVKTLNYITHTMPNCVLIYGGEK